MHQSKQVTILVVDDDAQVRRAIELILQHSGYKVEMASSGKEGVDKFVSYQPDLILMDVMMPTMDGFETIERIQRLPGGDRVPIILLSVLGGEIAAREKGQELGVCDSIAKPVKVADLRQRIQDCLNI